MVLYVRTKSSNDGSSLLHGYPSGPDHLIGSCLFAYHIPGAIEMVGQQGSAAQKEDEDKKNIEKQGEPGFNSRRRG